MSQAVEIPLTARPATPSRDEPVPLLDREPRNASEPIRSRPWASVAEFVAVGGATALLFPLAWLARRVFGMDASELAIGFVTFHAAFVLNDPHFSVTYLLFYRDARERAFGGVYSSAQRARYVIAGLVVPVLLAAWAGYALGSRSADTLGLMIQLMFLLVGWHYVKQGFGALSVLSARRGTPLAAPERRWLLVHCYAAWGYAWANPAAPAGAFEERGVVYHAFAHPRWLELAAGAALAASTVALAVALFSRWRRDRTALPAGPLVAFLSTVWIWAIFSALDPLVRYVIPALHSMQYLYFVWLMRRNEHRAHAGPFGGASVARLVVLALAATGLAFLLFHGVPGILDAAWTPNPRRARPDDLGLTPFAAAFYVFVNLHHYAMDAVIWRRENPETRYLLLAS